ncbi:SRPBCC family protein [Ferrovibrio sp.]|uniref:SRPBCC family protein n=1 Tax=Ferrovibrio sp. TaxID=1917215 RepID=UPI002603E8EC|nr:SRPBCC family protein [Ferrovibrio sp.]
MNNLSMKHVLDNDAYGKVMESGAVRFERLLPGPIERVWDYITDSEKRGAWLAAGEMELRVGGKVTLNFHNAKLAPVGEPVPEWLQPYTGPITQNGRITLYEPRRLLGMTWGDNGDGSPASEVVFELTPKGKDVLLVLTHRRLTSNQEGLMVSCGWHVHLGVLVAQMNGDPAPAYWTKFDKLQPVYRKHFPE